MSPAVNSSPVRVGFVGCGHHACQNIYPCLGPAGAELVAAADLSAERREWVRRHWHPSRLLASGEALVASGGIDALFVVGPAGLHEKMVELGVQAGVPVFVEKPPATSASRARELADLAQERGVTVMTGFMKRFASAYVRAMAVSARPEFGGRRHLLVRYGHGQHRPLAESLPVMGIHALDLVRAFMGDPKTVQVLRQPVGETENLSLQMTFGGGGLATVILDATLPGVLERLELAGDGQFITVGDVVDFRHYGDDANIWGTPAAELLKPNFGLQTAETSTPVLQGYAGEVSEFISAVAERRPVQGATLADGAAALELCERIAATPDGESFSMA